MSNSLYFGQELSGSKPELFAPDIFDHAEGYHSPVVFSDDLLEVYWSPMAHDHSLLYSRLNHGEWSKPMALTFNLSRGIGDPFLWHKRNRLYFLSYEPPEGSSGQERERLWYADQVNGEWGKPVCLDPLLSSHPTHWKGSVSETGNIYFTSEINVATSGQDIYCLVHKDGNFEPPVKLNASVNSSGWEFGPCIAPDESFLIFTRRDGSTRKTDLLISFRSKDGAWSSAIDLGHDINSDENDLCPTLSPDGKYLFFLSTRDGKSKMYWVDMEKTLTKLKTGE